MIPRPRKRKGQGCFFLLLLVSTALVVLLFVFYYKGEDLAWRYLEKGLIERAVIPALPEDLPPEEQETLRQALQAWVQAVRRREVSQEAAQRVIQKISQGVEDGQLTREEVDALLQVLRASRGRPSKEREE